MTDVASRRIHLAVPSRLTSSTSFKPAKSDRVRPMVVSRAHRISVRSAVNKTPTGTELLVTGKLVFDPHPIAILTNAIGKELS